jgi:hypothetical protein
MVSEMLDLFVPGMQGFEGANDLSMEHLAGRWQKAQVGDVANPVMREVETFARSVEHATSYQLLDGLGGLATRNPGSVLQKIEREFSTDHRRHRRQVLTAGAQSVQATRDQLPDSLGRRQGDGR